MNLEPIEKYIASVDTSMQGVEDSGPKRALPKISFQRQTAASLITFILYVIIIGPLGLMVIPAFTFSNHFFLALGIGDALGTK